MLESRRIECPYCGEQIEVMLDTSAGTQHYVEDCQVCCRPIEFELEVDGLSGEWALNLKRDDD